MIANREKIIYPENDGNPIAENTLQFEWIMTLKYGFDALFADNPDVFVTGDLLWYPVEGEPKIRVAPDVLIALGRPKGHRGSYRQWEEANTPPQVVWEVPSPGNTRREMIEKGVFYDRHGVEEFYLYDPQSGEFTAIFRSNGMGFLERSVTDLPLVSPRLGVRFERDASGELTVIRLDGERFKTYAEIFAERNRLAAERNLLTTERDEERQRANAADAQMEMLLARIRELEARS